MKKILIWCAASFMIISLTVFSIQFSFDGKNVSLEMISAMASGPVLEKETKDSCTEIKGFCTENALGGSHCISIIDPDAMCK
jgi:hypothetical protein